MSIPSLAYMFETLWGVERKWDEGLIMTRYVVGDALKYFRNILQS